MTLDYRERPGTKGRKNMKIGLFTDTFYPEINGVATSCLNLQRELTRRGHEGSRLRPEVQGLGGKTSGKTVHYLASAPLLVLKDRNFAFPTPLTSWEAEKIDLTWCTPTANS